MAHDVGKPALKVLGDGQVAGRDVRAVVQLAQQRLKDLPRHLLGHGIAKDLD